ncbi:MAG: response regulator [Desulfofustis sp.]|nr:response regulator [Desulfofustis sp.]
MNTRLPKVFIVEDEQQIREHMLLYFEDFEEFRLDAADRGEVALEMLARDPADVCIVDIRLPGMDGEAFIRAAAAAGSCRRFILHTGSVDLLLSEHLRALGLSDHDVFFKPCGMDLILTRVRELVAELAADDGSS